MISMLSLEQLQVEEPEAVVHLLLDYELQPAKIGCEQWKWPLQQNLFSLFSFLLMNDKKIIHLFRNFGTQLKSKQLFYISITRCQVQIT